MSQLHWFQILTFVCQKNKIVVVIDLLKVTKHYIIWLIDYSITLATLIYEANRAVIVLPIVTLRSEFITKIEN